jgi:hypothetical protein
VSDLLNAVYEAHGRLPPSQAAIEKQVERFSKLNSFQRDSIELFTRKEANSGVLRKELLAYYPDHSLP